MAAASRIAAVLGGAVSVALLGASLSMAQGVDSAARNAEEAAPALPINFTDPDTVLESASRQASVNVDDAQRAARFHPPESAAQRASEGPRGVELEFAANAGAPVDVAFAHRASIAADSNGDISQAGRGSEVRIGRGLVQQRAPDADGRSVYMFVASDNEALTWRPGARAEGAGPSLALEDRVEIGDISAGVTYERNGVQASLAYVEREIEAQVGRENFSQDERFAGVTVTLRR